MIIEGQKKLLFLLSALFFYFSPSLYASGPVVTLTALTSTSISVPSNGTATVQYSVKNQSSRPHTWVMQPIAGITRTTTGSGFCGVDGFTLQGGASCTLSLSVDGSQLTRAISGGPILCEQGSNLLCVRPNASSTLNIKVGIDEYTVGGTVSGLTGSVVLQNNGSDNHEVSSDGEFTFPTSAKPGARYAVTIYTQPSGQTCTVTDGVGTVSNRNIDNVGVRCLANTTTLSSSVSNLALSVNDVATHAALTGTPRLITITNTGDSAATNVVYSLSSALPSGTTISPATCGRIEASEACVLTITPGPTPSSVPGDPNAAPIELSVFGSNTNTVNPKLYILTHASVYQAGYLYDMDDTTPNTVSVGGTVLALTEQASDIIWSSNGVGGDNADYVSEDIIPGIGLYGTVSNPIPTYAVAKTYFEDTYANANTLPFPDEHIFTICDSDYDGACNEANIVMFYDRYVTNFDRNITPPYTFTSGVTPREYYAAGACKGLISGYNDWYLFSLCEAGPSTNGGDCDAQNIVESVPGILGTWRSTPISCTYGTQYGATCMEGQYWTSTQHGDSPAEHALVYNFSSIYDDLYARTGDKLWRQPVRCARHLTQ